MGEITLEDLRMYIDLQNEIKAIELEIESLYYPIRSAPMTSDGSTRSSLPGNPTERAVFRIEEKKKKLERKRDDLIQLTERLERFVAELKDHHVAAIIRLHFLCGKTWGETCYLIFGYYDKDTCRKTVKRFFEGRTEGK